MALSDVVTSIQSFATSLQSYSTLNYLVVRADVLYDLSQLERCVDLPYDAIVHYQDFANRMKGVSKNNSQDERRLASALCHFQSAYPYFAIGEFLEERAFWYRRMKRVSDSPSKVAKG